MDTRTKIVHAMLMVLISFCYHNVMTNAADPDILSDFLVPAGVNVSSLEGSFFTSSLLRNVPIIAGSSATVTPVNFKGFPALEGLGVSFALLQYPPGTVNGLHLHPRGSELLYVIHGTLHVGFIDSTNKLFTQTLHNGDLFIFPRGLVHFQINSHKTKTVTAVAGFSSSSPGLIKLRGNLFQSGISEDVLEKSFGVSADVIKALSSAVSVS